MNSLVKRSDVLRILCENCNFQKECENDNFKCAVFDEIMDLDPVQEMRGENDEHRENN